MAAESSSNVFGDDINATPLSKLSLTPKMTSRSDSGGAVAPPVYNPTIEADEKPQKKVRFDDSVERQQQRIGKRRYYAPSPAAYRPPPAAPQQQPAALPKKKRLVELMASYSHLLVVIVLVAAILWYYPKLSAMPYVGGSYGSLSVFGIALVACSAGGLYGVAEHVID